MEYIMFGSMAYTYHNLGLGWTIFQFTLLTLILYYMVKEKIWK